MSKAEMVEVLLELERSDEAPRISRSRIASSMREELGSHFDDVALVISELVSNSVRHGDGKVLVAVRSNTNRIRLEVSDRGPCFDSGHRRGDGLGLSIVDKVADAWGVTKENMCTVWAEISLD